MAVLSIISACEPLSQPPQSTPTSTEANLATATSEPTSIPPTPTATEQPVRVWFDPAIPEELLQGELKSIVAQYGAEMDDSPMRLSFSPGDELSQWIFALVAPFSTVQDSIDAQEFLSFWQTGASDAATELVVDLTVFSALSSRFGMPAANVKMMAPTELLAYCQANNAWAVIPFERISPPWKVIQIDGQSPLHKSFDLNTYPLRASISLSTSDAFQVDPEIYASVFAEFQNLLPSINRDSEKLTTVILTGVTALTRATAKEMEIYGVLSPAKSISDVMVEADIAHVSNEVPFATDCPEPQWVQEVDLVFCSDDSYIDLLKEIGTDVVELTGDHFSDWGPEAMLHTLEMYDAEGWSYYGGGKDIEEARAALKMELNGNKIAFIGCNAKAPGYATASETNPGAYHCDMEYMVSTIKELRAEGYMVISTFQHDEIYLWQPEPNMVADFRQLAEAGATIVSGSQAHQPHIYEFWEDSFIHYGLGNLFFDQLGWYDDSDKAFIDRHVFYDGKYLGVELLTTQFFNWSTPTWMTPEARAELLTRLFQYSQTD
jgi:poly-gamma-glutamate synthesis protein (capsule biosynthesis protein)